MTQKKIGSQGIMECDVAYQLGFGCPIGQEPILLVGIDQWWPDLQSRPQALDAFLCGLTDRFEADGLISTADATRPDARQGSG